MTVEQMQAYIGFYGSNKRSMNIYYEDGHLHYRDRASGGRMVPVGEHKFVSALERKRTIEFVPNDAGEIDLAFWTRGKLEFHGYKQPQEENTGGG